jgi:hypothetical protein
MGEAHGPQISPPPLDRPRRLAEPRQARRQPVVGRRGAHVTIGHGQIRETVGPLGTGISYTATAGRRRQVRKQASIPMTLFVLGIIVYVVVYAVLHALGVVG